MNSTRNLRVGIFSAVAGVFLLGVGGCVERKITIGSEPEGALVALNDEEIGRTPVTVPFTWYGDYDVVLRLEKNVGTPEKPVIKRYYLHTHKQTVTPAFEIVPLDFFAALLPVTFKDEQVWAFPIPEVQEPKDDVLIQRARDLKGTLDAPDELENKKKGAAGAEHATAFRDAELQINSCGYGGYRFANEIRGGIFFMARGRLGRITAYRSKMAAHLGWRSTDNDHGASAWRAGSKAVRGALRRFVVCGSRRQVLVARPSGRMSPRRRVSWFPRGGRHRTRC